MTGLAVALLAALLLAVGSVAQRRAASLVPDDEAGGLGLLRRLVRSPTWWAGSVGDAGGAEGGVHALPEEFEESRAATFTAHRESVRWRASGPVSAMALR